MNFSATVEGLAELGRDLGRLAGQAIPAAINDAGLVGPAVERARSVVPVRTGRLRASVRGDVDRGNPVLAAGGGAVDYAAWIEYGGSKGRPYVPDGRYLYPSVQATMADIERGYSNAVTNTIDRFHWSGP